MQLDTKTLQNSTPKEKKLTLTVSATEEQDKALIAQKLKREYKKTFGTPPTKNTTFSLEKRSIDARHKALKIHLRYIITQNKEEPKPSFWSAQKTRTNKRVVIVGLGPAGLAAAITLVTAGIKPILIERGSDIHKRKQDIAKLCREGLLDANSNFAFGCGGAGAFSDGKLYTRSNKHTDIAKILQALVHFGADKTILTASHAHIGSNKLPTIIDNIMEYLSLSGCTILCNTVLTGLGVIEGRVHFVTTKSSLADFDKIDKIDCDAVILATGHSANDIYSLLQKTCDKALAPKPFALGVRVEHPRALIDKMQWGENAGGLIGAEYALKTQIAGRGVYSFCMCPGGVIVPAMTAQNSIVTNGMSASGRAGRWSNSAIVVETTLFDIEAAAQQRLSGENTFDDKTFCTAADALNYRTQIEKRAFETVDDKKDFNNDKKNCCNEGKRASNKTASANSEGKNIYSEEKDIIGTGAKKDTLFQSTISKTTPFINEATPTCSKDKLQPTLSQNSVSGTAIFSNNKSGKDIQTLSAKPPLLAAPAQLLSDFLCDKVSSNLPPTSFTPAVKSARLDTILGERVAKALKAAFLEFDKKMKGFVSSEALLIAPETRTSSPVRILRDKITMESVIKGLYPCGEGSGYAGGITTSAGDGIKAAYALLKTL